MAGRSAPCSTATARASTLQRALGNRAVTELVGGQTRLLRAPAVPATDVSAELASTSPQAELSADLHRELGLIANGRVLIAFLRSRRGSSSAVPSTLALADVLADEPTVKALTPRPRTVADLQPTVDLLIAYGVLHEAGTTLNVKIDPARGDVDTASFDRASDCITRVTTDFDRRALAKDPVHPTAATGVIDIAGAAGAGAEKQADRASAAVVDDLTRRLAESVVLLAPATDGKPRPPITRVTIDQLPSPVRNRPGVDLLRLPIAGSAKPVEVPAREVTGIELVASGVDPATVKLREKLNAALSSAAARMHNAQGYRTFAVAVVDFLNRLRARNGNFVAGTYPRHVWAEYSVDVFLTVAEDDGGFYARPQTERFLDDVNATALDSSGPYGAFQWHAVYNDPRMAATINAKYGAGRVHRVPHHGPAPDKLHIHLDLRPVRIKPDQQSGFSIGPDGRIKVP